MSLEKDIGRIADAMEYIASCLKSPAEHPIQVDPPATDAPPAAAKKTTKKKAAAKKAAPASGKVYTEDELRQCFQEYVGRKGNEEGTATLKQLIAKHGATKIGDIKPEDYGIIIEEVKSWK